ncbi:hypothetical protein F2P81_013384 [Scophthalmus maximus]|uniref:Uncharacterized protein n=1 Tax=Scophthalmus maximus TaxID=52904 RepID=A0A6A4SMD7_SCOMX|nr:hypothetical protein F2P81_013384 [Scophthalmus maximus]
MRGLDGPLHPCGPRWAVALQQSLAHRAGVVYTPSGSRYGIPPPPPPPPAKDTERRRAAHRLLRGPVNNRGPGAGGVGPRTRSRVGAERRAHSPAFSRGAAAGCGSAPTAPSHGPPSSLVRLTPGPASSVTASQDPQLPSVRVSGGTSF